MENFYVAEASRVFVANEEYDSDYCGVGKLADDLKERFEKAANEKCFRYYFDLDVKSEKEKHSFSSAGLGRLDKEIITDIKFKDGKSVEAEIGVTANIFVRDGYYKGCNLDYELIFWLNGYEVDLELLGDDYLDLSYYFELYNDNEEYDSKYDKEGTEKVLNKFKTLSIEVRNIIEEVFQIVSVPLEMTQH